MGEGLVLHVVVCVCGLFRAVVLVAARSASATLSCCPAPNAFFAVHLC